MRGCEIFILSQISNDIKRILAKFPALIDKILEKPIVAFDLSSHSKYFFFVCSSVSSRECSFRARTGQYFFFFLHVNQSHTLFQFKISIFRPINLLFTHVIQVNAVVVASRCYCLEQWKTRLRIELHLHDRKTNLTRIYGIISDAVSHDGARGIELSPRL